jgi:hypothetical protein
MEEGVMRLVKKALIAAFTAALLLSIATGIAGARTRVEVSTTAVLISGRVDIVPNSEQFPIMFCDVTLHVTLLRLINKVRLEHIGDVTSILTANLGSIGGTPRACTFLPGMRVQYNSIMGSLPNIMGVLLWINTLVLIEIRREPFVDDACLYGGLVGAAGSNPIRMLSILNAPPMPLVRALRGVCPATAFMSGVLNVTPELTIRLLES